MEGENFRERQNEAIESRKQELVMQAQELQEELISKELQEKLPNAKGTELLMRAVIALLQGKDGSDGYVREKLGRALNELDVAIPGDYQEAVEQRAQGRPQAREATREEGTERKEINVAELYERLDKLEQRLASVEIKMNN